MSLLLTGNSHLLFINSRWVSYLPAKSSNSHKLFIRAFARRKKIGRERRPEKSIGPDASFGGSGVDGSEVLSDRSPSEDDYVKASMENFSTNVASRSDVLQACTVTSGLLAALGVVIRQVSHVASVEGLPILDCSTEVSFDFELWHLGLITGLVILISSCRYSLLKVWPDFAESTQAANQQARAITFKLYSYGLSFITSIKSYFLVLTSLQPMDYIVVSLLPGVSEELLFRGSLLPLFGMDWKSVLVVAIIFGVLHIGGGRKYSFAIWATFVGVVYGYATIASSSLIVPMAAHALNNLVGGILWRQKTSTST